MANASGYATEPLSHSINESAEDNENFFNLLPENRHVTPIPEENPFDLLPENRDITPIPDLHLHSDNGGPSEPISWAFQCQGLADALDIDPRSSPLGVFGENSSPSHSTSNPATAVRDVQVDTEPEPQGSPLSALREAYRHSPLPTPPRQTAPPPPPPLSVMITSTQICCSLHMQ